MRSNAAEWGIKTASDAPMTLGGKLVRLHLLEQTLLHLPVLVRGLRRALVPLVVLTRLARARVDLREAGDFFQ